MLLLLWAAEMPIGLRARWQYMPQDLEEALKLLNEDREIIGYNIIYS